MKQTLDPIQHILDKLSYDDACDIIDFFSELHLNRSGLMEGPPGIEGIVEVDGADGLGYLEKLKESMGTEFIHVQNHIDKIGTVDVFDEIYPKKESTQLDKDIEATFGYKPVPRPE